MEERIGGREGGDGGKEGMKGRRGWREGGDGGKEGMEGSYVEGNLKEEMKNQ